MTSWQKWMNQAQNSPLVSTMDRASSHPSANAMATPTTPYGMP